ncbi:MAG: hypothetical protein NVSMB55_27860 [Mycobacteriales bacterium]
MRETAAVSDWLKNALLALLALAVLPLAGYALTSQGSGPSRSTADVASVVPPAAPVLPAPSPHPSGALSCAFLGDSYAAGEGASTPTVGMAAIASALLGCTWVDDSQGSTGYVTADRQKGRAPFGERLDAALAAHPSLLILAGGTTDATQHAPLSVVRARSQAAIERALGQQTTRRVVVLGPWWPDPTPSGAVLAVRDIVKANAVADGVVFLDPIGERWISSLADTVAYIRAGTIYPTDAGYAYFARRLVSDLKRRNRTPIP